MDESADSVGCPACAGCALFFFQLPVRDRHADDELWKLPHAGLLVGDRVQVNLIAPPYVQNNSATAKDGFGDTQLETKVRVASGNASMAITR